MCFILISHVFVELLCSFSLIYGPFDPSSFDPLALGPGLFEPLALDPGLFDLMLVNMFNCLCHKYKNTLNFGRL